MPAVIVEHESIRYITGDVKDIGFKEYLIKKIQGKFVKNEFWANRGISFTLEKGDMLGIIGSNGAGKSTLLKAISGLMKPTEGRVEVSGQIAALLELTAGFDPDLTVRENTYLRGALLGYTKKFMDERYGEIIAFAELEDFQDWQIKQLSSGMKSRLAFSIACLVDPDVLILDEVLSVGDGAFRRKSGDKMREILARGVTGLLVSHSIEQVRELCNKILWLDHGVQVAFTDEVTLYCDAYEEFLETKVLPRSREDIEQLAADYAVRMEEERQKKAAAQTAKLVKVLEAGSSDEALEAALRVIRKQRPELLINEQA